MKSLSRVFLFAALTAIVLAGNASKLMAQNAATDSLNAKVEVARQISWNLMRLVGGLADHFLAFKGDSVATVDNGVVCYAVKGIQGMNADHDYIMKSPDGHAYYLAYISGDDARLRLYEIAFVLGIDTFDANKDHALTASIDALSSADKEVYNLNLKGTKVGSFSWDKVANNIYIIIGFIK